jgi:orotate phosphoribosyltransferase
VQDRVQELLAARRGHFRFESGHHGSLWLDLELLCLQPRRLPPLASALAARLAPYGAECVCGPLVEGAFVAQLVAVELGASFTCTRPAPRPEASGLFPVAYHLPEPLRPAVAGRRVAIVNDVINAGSAVRGTLADLRRCGARPLAIGTLAVLGEAAVTRARRGAAAGDARHPASRPLAARGVPAVRGRTTTRRHRRAVNARRTLVFPRSALGRHSAAGSRRTGGVGARAWWPPILKVQRRAEERARGRRSVCATSKRRRCRTSARWSRPRAARR